MAAQATVDVRVEMVLEVLAGRTAEDVAGEWDLDPALLHRWVRDFLVAGTAAVTNRPDPDEARQRDRFLAAFAHELRTPVSVATGWAMVLAEGDVPVEQVPDSLDRLADNLAKLSGHIADVEMAASLSLGRKRVNAQEVVVADVCARIEGHPVVRTGADLTVVADPALLERIVGDLWRTAHRDPSPASVAIDVVESGAWLEVRVERTGEPIGPMVLKALFDPFGSNDDSTGVTMGLYLARALTVAHGGILGAEGEGDTTVLYTRLPIDPPSPRRTP